MSSGPPNTSNNSLKTLFANNRTFAIIASLVIIGFLAMAVLVAILLLQRDDGGSGSADVTPTPFTETVDPLIGSKPLVVGESDSIAGTNRISVTVDIPTTLQVGAQSFTVQSQQISADSSWSPSFDDGNTAVWVYGTIVNYVIGLSDTDENRTLLEEMTAGDQMVLETRNGVRFSFSFNSREQVLVGARDVYSQQTPGLTLILAGSEGEERLVVNGRYIVDEAGGGQGQGNIFELGETAQLEDLQITVTGAVYLLDRPEARPGFAFYLLDYQIQNSGLTAVNSTQLRLTLLDEMGNQYAVSPVAAQLGTHPALSGFLNASQTVQATAGYQIPLGLNSSSVLWTVAHEGTGAELQVTIPFSGGSQAAQNMEITLESASVSSDLTGLILSGTIVNLGEQPAVISASDITLKTADGSVYLLLSTNPAFPWTVAGGQPIQYLVTFQRPTGTDAVFTILNQPFQLGNLR